MFQHYLINSFSVNMLSPGSHTVRFEEISAQRASQLAAFCDSAVGQEDMAAVFSAELGQAIHMSRTTASLQPGTVHLLGQYYGPRLPAGATTLPQGAFIEWYLVHID